eukprot:Plantae.Rhodophyta-Hildenbrandia_rubra.ctg17454.p1 GENE.Plantae.Rhodophyta-Hildenbrandia_rubra.ctg17454~~Plantae.Rhodophyta-Hildenbrandia_rubra.ctg17454.p1  ORF type:complete len:115 (+),score=15.17 Plantae.Rhodophyta-Hildenbrandia_rubra.ctg17454:827-1171(+)
MREVYLYLQGYSQASSAKHRDVERYRFAIRFMRFNIRMFELLLQVKISSRNNKRKTASQIIAEDNDNDLLASLLIIQMSKSLAAKRFAAEQLLSFCLNRSPPHRDPEDYRVDIR